MTGIEDKLRRLSSHLHNMDSGSGEGRSLWDAADAIQAMHGHLLSARRYVHAYTENEANHPQARDNANALIHQIDTTIAKLK